MVSGMVREFYNLVFKRGTVSNACSRDCSVKKWSIVEIISDNLMRFLIGVGDVTGYLFNVNLFR